MLSAVLLSGIGSLAAATYTWDPSGPTTTGTNGGGTWNASAKIFTTGGTTDVAFPDKGSGFVYFGTNTTTNGNAGAVTVTDPESAGTIRFYETGSTVAANGTIPGYVFSGSGTITANNIGLFATNTQTTINVPLMALVINFAAGTSTLSLNATSTIGVDSSTSASPNIQGSSVGFGAQGTLLLNTGTYTIGTSIAIGTTSTASSTGTATGGVQVNAGAILTPSTTSGALTDLGVGGYAANGTTTKTTNGSGLLMINGGTVTTGSSSTVYINNNTGTPAVGTTAASGPGTYALSGQLIVNSGVLTAGNQIVVGNSLSPNSGVTQSAELDVNGGVVVLTNTGSTSGASILVNNNNNNGAAGTVTATVNIAGGTTTVGTNSGIVLNAGGGTVGTSTLNVSGGSLFLGNGGGSGGISNSGGGTASVNFSGGTVGAATNWQTRLPITLTSGSNGNVTFQTSNLGANVTGSNAPPATTFYTAQTASPFTIELDGALSGTGGLITSGGGTLMLTAANTYTGTTSVTAGTLLLSHTGIIGAATPASMLTVNSAGTLAGTGVLTVTSASVAGTIAPAAAGATTGFLTLNTTSGLTLTGNLLVGISGSNSVSLTTSGQMTLNGATLSLSTTTLDGVHNYDIANYGTLSGQFTNFTVPSGYSINYDGTNFVATNGGTADIELDVASTSVPEPATWAGCLLGLGLLTRSWCQRRSRRGISGLLVA